MSNIYNLADTWNSSVTTFDSIKMNISNGAAGAPSYSAGSMFFRLQSNATDVFAISPTGDVYQGGNEVLPALNGVIASQNVALGIGAFASNTIGNGTVAIGYNALTASQTGVTTVAIGNSALAAYTGAGSNVAIGSLAMTTATAGTHNCAVGFNALQSLQTGSNNTAVGTFALQALTAAASHNTALGCETMIRATSSGSCTAVGRQALQFLTGGAGNTAVGAQALNGLLTTSSCTGVGNNAGAACTGNNATYVGANSGPTSTGSNNVMIGYNTGGGITDGNFNTIIGTSLSGFGAHLSNAIVLGDGNNNVRLDYNFNTTNAWTSSASIYFSAAAAGPVLKRGANGMCGTFVANGATEVPVGNTVFAITDAVIFSLNTVGGTPAGAPYISSTNVGTGFGVKAAAGDTSTYNYAIIKNAA